ncbi:MAG: hypothetical protein N3E50_09180 [Candidatus Goldbacteria bacterium]|nr:hypothetical protein [Candidatus Goldiibacteriota bacterium]
MFLFNGGNDENSNVKKILAKIFIFIIIFLNITGFEIFSKTKESNKVKTSYNVPAYYFTPTPTITPVSYPQLFYFKANINQNLKFPELNTYYILSGNNDNNYKYLYVLITSPASDDITFISYMFELGEKAGEFEYVGSNTNNARYNFVRRLIK